MTEITTYQAVMAVVNDDVRPGLKIHGGGVDVLRVADDGQVELEFTDACRGCALQSVTFAVAIRQRLLEVPGVSEVTMKGVRVSAVTLERISEFYRGYEFGRARLATTSSSSPP